MYHALLWPILGALLLYLSSRFFLPMKAVRLQLGNLLAADTTTLAPVLANQMALIIAPFTALETLVIGDLTLGAANGLGPIALATGSQEVAIDPTSQAQILTLKPGATSGFRWVTSGVFAGPVTVYGFALIDSTSTTLLAVSALAAPVIVSAAGYQIEGDPAQMVFVLEPIN